MKTVSVHEFAQLTTSQVEPGRMHLATVSQSAFDWLCAESARLSDAGASLVQLDGRRTLRLDNYVGVIETPCGTRVEILPKTVDGIASAPAARRLLRKMLSKCLSLRVRETGRSAIQAFDAPLTEWVVASFLASLEHLVKRGVRFDYRRVQEQQRFLRGRLDMGRQLRQAPGRQHVFQIEHDVFDADRAENRLLRSALDVVAPATRDASNWRLARELSVLLESVPPSKDVDADFRAWRDDRLLAHYQPVRPWCALILNEQTPLSVLGEWHGSSLLFPMEKVFERYVEACLRKQLLPGAVLKAGARQHSLCSHGGDDLFLLIPDFLLAHVGGQVVLDTKWKRLDGSVASRRDKYGLKQSDFYQMFAYGERYLGGEGNLYLVFPRTTAFDAPLPVFAFNSELRLWVVPFDMETEELVRGDLDVLGLVSADRKVLDEATNVSFVSQERFTEARPV